MMEKYYIFVPGVPPGLKNVNIEPAGAIVDTILREKKPTIQSLKTRSTYKDILDFQVKSAIELETEFDVDGNYYYKKPEEDMAKDVKKKVL